MHEYSIVQSLLGRVDQSMKPYDVVAVRRLRVRLGALSGVDPGLLRTAFELCTPGTRCAEAELEIEEVPVRWRCPQCGRDGAEGQRLSCVSCGVPLTLAAGDEIVLETVDLEVQDV